MLNYVGHILFPPLVRRGFLPRVVVMTKHRTTNTGQMLSVPSYYSYIVTARIGGHHTPHRDTWCYTLERVDNQELWDVSFIVPRRYGARALQRRMQFSFLNNPKGLADRALKPTTKG